MDRLKTIAALAVPIVGGMVSQNVLNLVDTWMVGSLGDVSLAAVSTASFLNFACIALITGLSGGVQAVAARRVGEGRISVSAQPLHEALLISLVVGVPATAALLWAAPALYALANPDPIVGAEAVPYLQARLAAVVAVGMNFSFRGYWNGLSRSRLYLNTLLIMHAVNVPLSYGLIFGIGGLPELGSLGAGVGTAAATWLGTGIYFVLGWRHARDGGFMKVAPDLESLRSLLRLAVPGSVQQFLFAMGINVMFGIIATLGVQQVAAAGVLINLTLVLLLPSLALGMAATTLVGQALGHGDTKDAARWGWDVVKVAMVAMAVLGVPMVLVPEWMLAPFLPGRPETVALAALPLRIVGATMAIDAVGMVLMQALVGAGAARFVAGWATGLQWGLFLPAAWLVGARLGGGLTAIWLAQAAQRAIQTLVFAWAWRAGWWKTLKV